MVPILKSGWIRLLFLQSAVYFIRLAFIVGLSEFHPDIQKQSMFLHIDETEKCKFALEFSSISPEVQEAMENKFEASFVNLRQSLFLLPASHSMVVSQVCRVSECLHKGHCLVS